MNSEVLKSMLPYSYTSRDQYEIVSKVGYLLGIPEKTFAVNTNTLDHNIFKELEKDKRAVIVRNLCMIRTVIESNLDYIIRTLRGSYGSIASLHTLFSEVNMLKLNEYGVVPFRNSNKKLVDHVIYLNGLISDRINNCRDLFPDWVVWEYIRSMFIMPDGMTSQGVTAAGTSFYHGRSQCPFQVYCGHIPSEQDGYVLLNDNKFLTWIYERNEDSFTEHSRVRDADDSTKSSISQFIAESNKIVFAVDCENSDPVRLLSALSSLKSAQLSRVSKILLLDDVNTSKAWARLHENVSIPVEHVTVERVSGRKSLVDAVLIAKVCTEFYRESVDSFILFSSDSDFYGLISTLPEARFLVMVESDQVGTAYKSALTRDGVYFCYLDDFNTSTTETIRRGWIATEVVDGLNKKLKLNLDAALDAACASLFVELNPVEREAFLNKYLRDKLYLTVDAAGNLGVALKKE